MSCVQRNRETQNVKAIVLGKVDSSRRETLESSLGVLY